MYGAPSERQCNEIYYSSEHYNMRSSSRVFDRSIPNILMQLSGNGSEYETGEERKRRRDAERAEKSEKLRAKKGL